MNAKSLNEKIDQLAEAKSSERFRRLIDDFRKAMEPYWWTGGANGKGEFQGEIVRKVIAEALVKSDTRDWSTVNESLMTKQTSYYRNQLLEEVFEKLPLVKELTQLINFNGEQS